MQRPNAARHLVETDGVVRRVDPTGREVVVQIAGTPVSFDTPPDCIVTLRGERVKLRLIQPRDRVRVAYTERRGSRFADAIGVQPGGPAPV